MKSLAKAVMLILLLFNAGVLISSASPPPLPNTFSGTVKFANSSGQFDVPAGTVIEALIENVTKGSSTVIEAGKYRIDVSGTYDDDGKNITFIVNNLTAEQRAIFNASSPPPRTLNLIVNLHEQTIQAKPKVPRKPIAGKLEVILIPENPTTSDNVSMEVKLTYPTAGYKVKFGNASIKNNTITVNVDSEEPRGMAAQVITTHLKKYNLGYLSEGAYTCEVYINGVLSETHEFEVSITVPQPPPASGGGGAVDKLMRL